MTIDLYIKKDKIKTIDYKNDPTVVEMTTDIGRAIEAHNAKSGKHTDLDSLEINVNTKSKSTDLWYRYDINKNKMRLLKKSERFDIRESLNYDYLS